jgi:hypothetical protein
VYASEPGVGNDGDDLLPESRASRLRCEIFVFFQHCIALIDVNEKKKKKKKKKKKMPKEPPRTVTQAGSPSSSLATVPRTTPQDAHVKHGAQ